MFKNFISLGGACDVAMGLKKYYLRTSSGPFDWIVSSYDGVIKCIESDFEDYLSRSNLFVEEGNGRHFWDKKYNFQYLHDVKNDLNEDYNVIKNKYDRRVQRFKNMINEPTCFVRRIRNDKEVAFIRSNSERIQNILKKSNSLNEVVYLLPKPLKMYKEELQAFIGEPWNKMKAEEMTNIFDTSLELISYLLENAEADILHKNILRSQTGLDNKKEYMSNLLASYYNELFVRKKKIEIDPAKRILILGGGTFGKLFYEMLNNQHNVISFVDTTGKGQRYGSCSILDIKETGEYIDKLGINKKELLAVVCDVWKYDEQVEELRSLGIEQVIPLSFILQKSLGMWSAEEEFKG